MGIEHDNIYALLETTKKYIGMANCGIIHIPVKWQIYVQCTMTIPGNISFYWGMSVREMTCPQRSTPGYWLFHAFLCNKKLLTTYLMNIFWRIMLETLKWCWLSCINSICSRKQEDEDILRKLDDIKIKRKEEHEKQVFHVLSWFIITLIKV